MLFRRLLRAIEKSSHALHAKIVLLSKNAADLRVRIGLIFLLSAATTLIGAALYSFSTGSAYLRALVHIYAVLYAVPGSTIVEEKTIHGTVIINCVFLIGLLVFAVLLVRMMAA